MRSNKNQVGITTFKVATAETKLETGTLSNSTSDSSRPNPQGKFHLQQKPAAEKIVGEQNEAARRSTQVLAKTKMITMLRRGQKILGIRDSSRERQSKLKTKTFAGRLRWEDRRWQRN
jgi:hypothetical protein